ncbi:hypothetical protein BDY19DRAFT_967050 [Irpex rosettiformis]|uniref:Uncharacterized protein n=1 Tax=Irpex rosettiformis TaxID=378272 RepID=A0ACB8TTF0_9APHY|nr:hypothetical protein BDY19DRAFT_967050 [Irpex rosettiformis]
MSSRNPRVQDKDEAASAGSTALFLIVALPGFLAGYGLYKGAKLLVWDLPQKPFRRRRSNGSNYYPSDYLSASDDELRREYEENLNRYRGQSRHHGTSSYSRHNRYEVDRAPQSGPAHHRTDIPDRVGYPPTSKRVQFENSPAGDVLVPVCFSP